MKRLVSSILCAAILIACLSLSLSSCAGLEIAAINRLEGKERAAAVFLRMAVAVTGTKSYTLDSKSDFNVTLAENKNMTVHVEQTDTFEYDGSDIKAHRTDANSTVTIDGQDPVTENQTIAFADGKLSIADDLTGVKIFSAASFDDAKGFFEENRTDDLEFDDISSITCDYEEGMGWTLTLSEMSGKTLGNFSESIESLDYVLDDTYLDDVVFKMTVSESFIPSSLSIEYVFASNSPDDTTVTVPTMKLESTFRDFGSTKVEVDLTGYTEVADITLLKKVKDTLDEAKEAQKGSFEFSSKSEAEFSGKSSFYSEEDTVTYEEKDGKFTYNITAFTNEDLKITITYADGKQTAKIKALVGSKYYGSKFSDQTSKQSEAEAKAFINAMIDSGSFNIFNISSIELKEESNGKKTYELKVGKPNTAQFTNALRQNGFKEEDADFDATFTVVMEGDRLVEYTYVCTCTGNSSKKPFSIKVTTGFSAFSYYSEPSGTDSTPDTGVEM